MACLSQLYPPGRKAEAATDFLQGQRHGLVELERWQSIEGLSHQALSGDGHRSLLAQSPCLGGLRQWRPAAARLGVGTRKRGWEDGTGLTGPEDLGSSHGGISKLLERPEPKWM